MKTKVLTLLGTAGSLLAASNGTYAQSAQAEVQGDTLQEVVVTAQRREEKMVDVPISIQAISTQELATANVQNLSDIAQLTPSLRIDMQTGFYQPSIRGIGTAVTTSGGGSNVGIYLDGFYSPNPQAGDFQLLNVSGIQVLKGPQGTLFGHNTTGGAILVTSSDPSTETSAEAKASYGRFNAQRVEGYATGGLFGGLAADVAAIFYKGDGFVTNIFNNNDEVGAYENWSVRTGLKAEFGDRVSAVLRYTHQRQDDPTSQMINSNTDSSVNPTTGLPWGITTFAVPGKFTTNPDQVAQDLPSYVRSNNNILQLTVKADLGFGDLTSYTQWRQEDNNSSENLDQTALQTFQLGLPIFDSTSSQEFLLSSKPGTRLQWTTGVFAFSNRDQYITYIDTFEQLPVAFRGAIPLPFFSNGRVPLGGSSSTTESIAYYLDGTYELVPNKLFFTAGARVSHDMVGDAYYDTSITRARNPVASVNSNKVTPRAVIRYKTTEESSVYLSFSEGYKARIIDVGGSCQDPPAFKCNPIQPEDIYAYEVGYKFESGGFSNELSVYDYQYKNLQVSEFLGAAEAFIVNAAQSRIYGADEEFHFKFQDHVQLNGGVAYTHGRYTTFGTTVLGQIVGAPVYETTPGGIPAQTSSYASVDTSTILHNTHMQHTPDWTANFGPRYSTGPTDTGEYSLSANVYYSSNFFFSPSGTQFAQPSYTTVALRAQWDDPSKKYFIALLGDNVTDIRYRTQVQYNGFGIGASWNEPASWAIEVGAKL